jgi:2-keto-4-pentenoate hydratase/2-oxohepta-3-ene-1,7-dioic acid hydratase in catechol pathway
MKLGSFEINGSVRLGAFEADRVVDLNAAYAAYLSETGTADYQQRADSELPSAMLAMIEYNETALPAAERAMAFVRKKNFMLDGCVYPTEDIIFRASHRPPKMVCTGVNYEDYRKLIGIDYSPVPLTFLKSPSAVIGHNETIYLPVGYGIIYHEWEFSCVISKKCRHVSKEDVDDVIFGYTIVNDITGRSLEANNREFQPWGKNMDTFAPMGPWIVTPDDMPEDIYSLKTLRRRNGKLECESNTSNMRLGFGDIIEFVTNFWTLEPGDVVTTATPPAGPIAPGDVIEAEIEGIGVLKNPVEGVKVDLKYAHEIKLEDIV